MRIEYIADKGTHKVSVVVDIYVTSTGLNYHICDVGTKEKGKRKFIYIAHRIRDDYQYRHRDYDKREEYVKEKFHELIDDVDVSNALNYAYTQFKPDVSKVEYRVF